MLKMSIGLQLQQVRESLGLTVQDAARRAGITSVNVLAVEGGHAYLSTALKYANGLNRRIGFRIDRSRKDRERVVELAARAGVSVDTVYRALPTLAEPSRAHDEAGDLQLSTVHALCEALGAEWFVLRVR